MSRFEDPERIKKIEGYKPNGSGINPNNGKLHKYFISPSGAKFGVVYNNGRAEGWYCYG